MAVFVDEVPSWRHLYDDVSRTFGIEAVANVAYAWCPGSLSDALGCEDVFNSAELEEKVFAVPHHFSQLELFLFEELVVDV